MLVCTAQLTFNSEQRSRLGGVQQAPRKVVLMVRIAVETSRRTHLLGNTDPGGTGYHEGCVFTTTQLFRIFLDFDSVCDDVSII